MHRKKIIIADDHSFMIEGVQTILKDDTAIKIIATAQNGYQLIDAVIKELPDLIILDLNMPGKDGMSSIEHIKKGFSSIKILVLSNYTQPDLICKIKNLGVNGFISKNTDATELRDAIHAVLSGKDYFQNLDTKSAADQEDTYLDNFMRKFQLTSREVGIIRLICKEKTTKEIAAELFLSELTINTHRRNINRKLDIKNTAGLINFARQYNV
jgi:DNA-binding NarL/FixJ family response regulator